MLKWTEASGTMMEGGIVPMTCSTEVPTMIRIVEIAAF